MEEKIIWQPQGLEKGIAEYKILLNRQFAYDMINLGIDIQDRFNEYAQKYLKKEWSHLENIEEPYHFYCNTGLIERITLGHNSTGLIVDENAIKELLKHNQKDKNEPLYYRAHHVRSDKQVIALFTLFDFWIQNSDIIKLAQ